LKIAKYPVENMLGAEGEGYKQALMTLGGGRLPSARWPLVLPSPALMLPYLCQTKRSLWSANRLNSDDSKLPGRYGDPVAAARLMLYHAAYLKDHGKKVIMEGSQLNFTPPK